MTTGILLLPRVRTSTGQRSFVVFGLATWNSIPPSLRASELSLSTFKCLLKTQLFQHAWTIVRRRCDWTASSAPHTKIRTQLNSTQMQYQRKEQCTPLRDVFDHPRCGVVYNMEGFCLSVCPSVCICMYVSLYVWQTITFESFDVLSLFSLVRYMSGR